MLVSETSANMLKASLEGRLRNTRLPVANCMAPIYETIVNAIQAIDSISPAKPAIELRIIREPEPMLPLKPRRGAPPLEMITAFEVIDNGVGFTDENMESFRTLDSLYKANLGGRGVGRLLWLKAFAMARIESRFMHADGSTKERSFEWNSVDGVVESDPKSSAGERRTVVRLEDFKTEYRNPAPKTVAAIAHGLIEHCLFYFVRPGGAPRITVTDATDRVDMLQLYDEYMVASSQVESVEVGGRSFDLTHIKLKSSAQPRPFIAWCASNRVVKEDPISAKIAGLHGRLNDEDGEFLYACYVTSDYFDENVRPERIGFDIPQSADELLAQLGPSMAEIGAAVLEAAERYLAPYLRSVRLAGRERVERYVSHKGVRYRPILRYVDEADLAVDPDISEKDLEALLHQKWYELEGQLISEGHKILKFEKDESSDDYRARVAGYLEKVDDIKKSDLANYVSHRKLVLEILERAIERGADGRYSREDLIHQLIVPMRKSSDEVHVDDCNLWLVDERLAFHNYLGSDKPIKNMPIASSSTDGRRPDICVLDVMDSALLVGETSPPASLTIVELKRPMREDVDTKDEDPIEQSLSYLRNLRESRLTMANGRPIPNAENIPGFLYIIADLTPKMVRCCEDRNLKPTSDGMGFFGFHDRYNAYIEVMSFDGVLKGANERNRAFFSKLGLPND